MLFHLNRILRVRSKQSISLFLIGTLFLGSCSPLLPKNHPNLPMLSEEEKAKKMDAETLAKIKSKASAIGLRVESDRYQSELLIDKATDIAQLERQNQWIEKQFQLAGLVPAGDATSSWRQSIGLIGYHSEGMVSLNVKGKIKTLRLDQGMDLWSVSPIKDIRLDRSEIVFISAPDCRDSSTITMPDLRGKIVLLRHTPSVRASECFSWAAHQGVAALILINMPLLAQTNTAEVSSPNSHEHFILRSATDNPPLPFVMGRLSALQALPFFGLSDQDDIQHNSSSPKAKPKENLGYSIIKTPIHIELKNTWKEYSGTHIVGKIPGKRSSNTAGVVFHTQMAYLKQDPSSFVSRLSACNYSALITSAQALSLPGDTPTKDIYFVVSHIPLLSNQNDEENEVGKKWKLQNSQTQPEVLEINLNTQGLFNNHEEWGQAAAHTQSQLEKSYLLSGPWDHH